LKLFSPKVKKMNTTLTGFSKKVAYRMLYNVTELLEKHSIKYHLEGGTLLGIVRDNELLPWDHDVDISIPESEMNKLIALKWEFYKLGYKFSAKRSKFSYGPIKKDEYFVFKLKPLLMYIGHLFIPALHRNMVILDIFVKRQDEKYTYWQAMRKVMKVENKYYESDEIIEFKGKQLRAPNHYKEYLTQKYGDWNIVVKDWVCGANEKTICK
jgi:lipopolysaccharide cholinephosphotransferase